MLERRFEILTFRDLGVGAASTHRLEQLGITEPLPIQEATIPGAIAGRDICGRAPTGSGKTLAFGLPLVAASSGAGPHAPRGLVLVPTRELAKQVAVVLASLVERPQRVAAIYGGTPYEPQRRALRRGVDVLVACPGRLEDLVGSGDVRLDEVRVAVLDEADRMVDMGFLPPVRRLLDATPASRQLLLFSATIGSEVEAVIGRYQRDPLRCAVEPESDADVTHHFWRTPRSDRVAVTAGIISDHGQAFVFCRTKRSAERVAGQLRASGVEAVAIHGDRSQAQRARALAEFTAGRAEALVATDVVARGIHVDDVPCVVHFDPPGDAESYVHRSGRTGRTGRSGTVVSLVHDDVRRDVEALQRALGLERGLTEQPGRTAEPAGTPEQARSSKIPVTSKTLRGTVKFFDKRRGFGFLCGPDGGDVFVHCSAVLQDGRLLRKGDRVSFEVESGRRGQQARNVVASVNGAA